MNHLNDDMYLIRGNNISSVKTKIKKQTFILMLVYSIVAISIINILPKGVNQGVVIVKSNEEIDRLSKQVNSEMIGNKTIFSLDPHKEDYNLKLAIQFAGQSSIYDVFVVNANEKNSTLVYYLNGKGITIILIQENTVISSYFFDLNNTKGISQEIRYSGGKLDTKYKNKGIVSRNPHLCIATLQYTNLIDYSKSEMKIDFYIEIT